MARRSLALAALALSLAATGCGGSLEQPSASNKVLLGKTRPELTVTRIGSLPQAISRAAAVALPGGKLMVLGGETGGVSTDRVLVGTPAHLRSTGRLPSPTHDAAAALVHGAVYLFGGGQSCGGRRRVAVVMKSFQIAAGSVPP